MYIDAANNMQDIIEKAITGHYALIERFAIHGRWFKSDDNAIT